MRKLTTDEFIKKAQIKHGAIFSYDAVSYVNAHTPVSVKCQIHSYFQQTPTNHLAIPYWKQADAEKILHNFLLENHYAF